MRAIILAAGRARRLRPITDSLPKTLIPINGKTIIDHQIDALRSAGVKDVVIVVGFEKDQIIRHVTTTHPDINFTFVENEKYLETGAAYSLWCARNHIFGDLLYINGDVLCDPKIIKHVAENSLPSVTAVQKKEWNEEQVNMEIDSNMSITEIGKHVPNDRSFGEFIGVTKFANDFSKHLATIVDDFVRVKDINRFAADAINEVIQHHKSPIYVLDLSEHRAIEIDTPEELETARRLLEG